MTFLPIILIFVVFYFLLIRPQQKKVKDHKSMVDSLRRASESPPSEKSHLAARQKSKAATARSLPSQAAAPLERGQDRAR